MKRFTIWLSVACATTAGLAALSGYLIDEFAPKKSKIDWEELEKPPKESMADAFMREHGLKKPLGEAPSKGTPATRFDWSKYQEAPESGEAPSKGTPATRVAYAVFWYSVLALVAWWGLVAAWQLVRWAIRDASRAISEGKRLVTEPKPLGDVPNVSGS